MAGYSLVQAAEMAGVSKATFWRLVKKGAVSATRADDGSYRIDASELDRYLKAQAVEASRQAPLKPREPDAAASQDAPQEPSQGGSLEVELAKLKWLLEMERERAAMERQRVDDERRRADELRQDRDAWRAQAERLALAPPAAAPAQTVEAPRRRWWRFG